MEPFGRREGYGNKAEWIVDLTTKADREGKHSDYANRYDDSELRRVNLKELDLQLDRGYRVSALTARAAPLIASAESCTGSWHCKLACADIQGLHCQSICDTALSAMRILQVSDEQMKELAVRTETTNPWYWGVRTLVKVGSAFKCYAVLTVGPSTKTCLGCCMVILSFRLCSL